MLFRSFCRKLTERERATSCIGSDLEYRLPSADEWLYATSAGAQTAYHFGDDDEALKSYEWCARNSDETRAGGPRDVALKWPTRWGLYDTFGNVREMCIDDVCGGCWEDEKVSCQIVRARRSEVDLEKTGFRVVLVQLGGPKATATMRSHR